MAKKVKKAEARPAGGPYLAAAFFCGEAIQGDDNTLSAIRIVDNFRLNIPHNATEGMPTRDRRAVFQSCLVIVLKTGHAPGGYELKLVIENPKGKRTAIVRQEIDLKSPPNAGLTMNTTMALGVYLPGMYWLDVYLSGRRATRVPFAITFERVPAPGAGGKPEKVASKKRPASSAKK